MANTEKRHVLGISGGKDSSALAIYMRDKVPQMEYFFCDTGKELKETYEYIDKLEVYLGKPIARLLPERDFDHWLQIFGNYLPSSRMRWCTRKLKIEPFENFVGQDSVISYVGIRADEDREGYISTKPNIEAVFPFREDNLRINDIYRILEDSGVGIPKYYEWRSRSGCYFCFFQRKAEWAGLLERHPDAFAEAMEYEKLDTITGQRFTWNQRESLEELSRPDRLQEIWEKHEKALANAPKTRPGDSLFTILSSTFDEEDDTEPCTICSL
ncbi:phosphoadenosine phosphosulfate reductase family protein [Terriglobus tenax]|uniref:phosphoadenosine phosphosulfate reductase family protein n=1 Tax=Terriglobus tenax TaxID=1111115 RepID=UPI0021DF91F6|nr:phosphoadenosine phosphosulfate reductase family protein [Terriglobus tenax]